MKNLALMVYITVGSAAYPILEFLEEWGTENFEVHEMLHYEVELVFVIHVDVFLITIYMYIIY